MAENAVQQSQSTESGVVPEGSTNTGNSQLGPSHSQNLETIKRHVTDDVVLHPWSTGNQYKVSFLGEWNLIYQLTYRTVSKDVSKDNTEGHCVCWQRVQAAHSIERYKAALNHPFLKAILGIKLTEFGIPITLGGNAMLWAVLQDQSHATMMDHFPQGFAQVMREISWWIGVIVMAVLMVGILIKLFTCRCAGMIEAIYHQRNSFLFAPMLAFIMLELSYPHGMQGQTAHAVVFWVAFLLQVCGALVVYRQWLFDHHRSLSSAPPSFLMGAVGWIFCGILGVRAGQLGFAWFSFTIGLLFYVLMLVLMMQSLPNIINTKGMRWTIFLNLAPPSVISVFVNATCRHEAFLVHNESIVSCLLVQLLFAYIPLFMGVMFFLEFAINYFPKRYLMELWAVAFPNVALAMALLQATKLPGPSHLATLQVPVWLAAFWAVLALLITLILSFWLLIALWRRQPRFVFNDPLLHGMHQNLQKRLRKECDYCRSRAALGLCGSSGYV
mmetsp:Transcript_22448/g.62265  ORF Transcript_22448/g.62265 Transcript_22448/m.62265 type:complete len:498 (+) Transcript_22448:179-1672(+)